MSDCSWGLVGDRRAYDEGGPCDHCRCLGGRHWVLARTCDCGRCPGYQVTERHPPHQWDRYSSDEARTGEGPGAPDVLVCGLCGKTERAERERGALVAPRVALIYSPDD